MNPNFNQKTKRNPWKKPLIIVGAVAIAICLWCVAAFKFGPNSERGIQKQYERLQQDSIELQGNFGTSPDAAIPDLKQCAMKIRDLGDPLRFGHTELDSARIFGNERLARIANYNIAKSDSVLKEYLPIYRRIFASTLAKELKAINENTIVRNSKDNDAVIEIYSIRYIDSDNLDSDASKYKLDMQVLGFIEAKYGVNPDSSTKDFDLTK